MATDSNDTQAAEQLSGLHDGIHKEEALDVTDDKVRTRHARWTRQETYVLIEGKKMAENRVQRARRSTSVWGPGQKEPKWESVSSYCEQRQVNRGPVQCMKRWSNLLSDFKKIKAWESRKKDEAKSFWMMRNELRRERKLPSFFDREVYNILDGRAFATEAIPLAHIAVDGCEAATAEEQEEHDETDTDFDGGQHATANGLFSDCEQSERDGIHWSFKKETISSANPRKTSANQLAISGTIKGKGTNTWMGSMSWEGLKRWRLSSDECEDTNLGGDQLLKVLERNGSMLNAQLEAQKMNCELDRDQRKEYNESLVAALNKFTDALVIIANKLQANH